MTVIICLMLGILLAICGALIWAFTHGAKGPLGHSEVGAKKKH